MEQIPLDLAKAGMAPENRILKMVRKRGFSGGPTYRTELKQFMVRGGFCQRSQFRGMQPAVGVWGGDVNVRGGYDQQAQPVGVGERVDFLALADAQGGSANQEKRDVGPQGGSNLQKPRRFELLTGELQIAQEGRGGVARAATQSAPCGNFFLQGDLHTR